MNYDVKDYFLFKSIVMELPNFHFQMSHYSISYFYKMSIRINALAN